MAYTKHLYNGEDLDAVKSKFIEIADMLLTDFDDDTDVSNEVVKYATLCLLNSKIYMLNDFVASSFAYKYIMPNVERFLDYLHAVLAVNKFGTMKEKKRKKVIREFATGSSKLTTVRLKDGSTKTLNNIEFLYYEVYVKQMAIAGRYYIRYNIEYLEMDKPEKDFPVRRRILEAAIWWANQMLLNKFGLEMVDADKYSGLKPNVLIFSTFPSSGKSYLCNTFNEMFCELSWMINKSGGVLRVGNEQGNIFRQSSQTKALIDANMRIFDIYPENKDFLSPSTGTYKPFAKSSDEEWGLAGCIYDPVGCIFKTRDSAINSVRCRVGMFDDPSRGQQECNNLEIHKQICALYNGDFMDRFKSQSEKCILLTGTMFNPYDVFSTEVEKAMAKGYEEDERFKNTNICDNGRTIVVINDCEDEYGNSAYPEFISNEDLKNKKEGLSDYDYHCTWRQRPIPAEGLIFAESLLNKYDKIDNENLSEYTKAYIDPTRRRASDFFAMPICAYNAKEKKWDLIDVIYEQSSSRDLYTKIINKVFQHRIVEIIYEENVDASMGDMLKQKLSEAGITYCTIRPVYNTVNKMQRILDMADTIKNNIRFPSKELFTVKTPTGFAVRQLCEFNGEKSQHDDFPDALAGFASEFIVNKERHNYIKSKKRLPI